jgi:hypothetical protein
VLRGAAWCLLVLRGAGFCLRRLLATDDDAVMVRHDAPRAAQVAVMVSQQFLATLLAW